MLPVPLAPRLARAKPARRQPLEPLRPAPHPAPWGHTYIPSDTDPVPGPWTWDLPPPVPKPEPEPGAAPLPKPTSEPEPQRAAQEGPRTTPQRWEPPAWPDAAPDEGRPPTHAARPPDQPRRLGRSLYDAEETHGRFGLVDTGNVVGGSRVLVAHVPRRSRGYQFDLRPGDRIHANSARGDHAVGGGLDVAFVTRHKYFPPGRAVTSCTIGVPDAQWRAVFGT